jgi:Rps23 Pro-64 3,4-dihydroxylase Tpa1-like proline 4-hydroxylase
MDNMYNKNIDFEKFKNEFIKNRRVVINDFLNIESAERLYNYYVNQMPKEYWCATYMPSIKYPGDWEWWKNETCNRYNMEEAYQHVCFARELNLFSYFFFKTMAQVMDNVNSEIYKETISFFNGSEMIEVINKLTDLNITVGEKTFVSRYSEKCFLSEHTDEPNGKLAFVYHLSKDWNPDWGGLYLDLRDKSNIKAICPSFNKLVIFQVTDGVAPHCVTEVVNNINKERISVSGWYN